MRKIMCRGAAALVVWGTLAGCAGYEWRKAGATPQQVMRDEELCQRHAESSRRTAPAGTLPGTSGLPGYTSSSPGDGVEVTKRYVSCMEARGYERAKAQ